MIAAATQHLPRPWARSHRADRRCRRYAKGLDRAMRAAHRPAEWSAAVPVQRAEVHAARDVLLTLAVQLRTAHDVPPVVLDGVRRLLTDCTSPLFAPAAPGALRTEVARILDELDDGGPEPE